MSWFNRAPRPKNPPTRTIPKHSSPLAEQVLEKAKQKVREKTPSKK